jgi:NAD(P)-dependent dehydrogenase (short-subunit alcohol dehydrogenase family)
MTAEQKVAIVTGGGGSLGSAFAEFFSADGLRVAVTDQKGEAAEAVAEKLRGAGADALAIAMDVTNDDDASRMAKTVLERWGRIDVLVNNAGIYGDHTFQPVTETSSEYWDLVMAVNLRGPLVCSKAVIPAMRRQKWGRIVNVTSMGSYILGGVYSTSKLALHHLTWSLAAETGVDGITVNGVGPGTMNVDSARRQNSEADLKDRIQKNIIKRLGEPRDIYAAIKYFCSEESGWCTGQVLMVNGGFNVHL